LTEEPVLNTPEPAPSSAVETDNLGVSEQERDDSFAWLESLAAKQGATEGLLTKPEERREEEPDWVKQAKGLSSTTPPVVEEPAVTQPAANLEDLGKTEQEQDDSFAWLENLAAKQGATEGLLTTPEERREEEPDWVKQAKEIRSEPSQPAPAPAGIEDLGKSEEERDDSFAWLESLAAKQGATEGLLTKPEERREEEPDWVKQAKDLSAQQPPVTPEPQQPAALDETGMWLRNLEESEKPVTSEPSADDTAMWLRSLEEVKPVEAEPAADETAMWLKNLEAEKVAEPAPTADDTDAWLKSIEEEKISEFAGDETAMWLKNVEEEKPSQPERAADETAMWLKKLDQAESAAEPGQPAETELPAWMQDISQEETPVAESPVPAQEPQPQVEEPALEEESIPSWLAELDQEEEKPVTAAADDDLPAWLRAEEGAPAQAEPTRASDWRHVEDQPTKIIYSPPLEEPEQPEIIYSPPLEETKQPEPEAPAPQPVHEEPTPEPEPVRTAPTKPTPTPEPYREPSTTRRSTGMLATPTMDPILGSARNELTRSNIPGALESYTKLIKKGRYLDEVIYDLREALYRYPVEVTIWQSLGDAYMRSNRLQDALDAYTKAEELLR
jgi:tetratricopeptide (TPR) repeat protein